ncbi:MAG: hypothetical protein U0V87_05275 [Acidobacteriota bacterium]
MTIYELLSQERESILREALTAVGRSHLAHYEADGDEPLRARLGALLDLARDSMHTRNATAMLRYAEQVAEERFTAGFDLREVQTAFNVLEESIFKRVLDRLQPQDAVDAIGLVGTVLGLGKDALARRYVALAAHVKAPSIDYRALFAGTA